MGLPGPGKKSQRVEKGKEDGEGKDEITDCFFVFVSSLSGSTVQIRVERTDSYESFAAKIVAKTLIHELH